eukprot:TRINITY_DN48025_c0_g1_i1.p1 TRINITY_DN48025_c0_g1~~TRINITY_DN48025_c0_g1_i1.p1  ORF type:complete len:548 (+),score=116.68 TRINITY_DN48025_c0_g1_i1:116-1759(+)
MEGEETLQKKLGCTVCWEKQTEKNETNPGSEFLSVDDAEFCLKSGFFEKAIENACSCATTLLNNKLEADSRFMRSTLAIGQAQYCLGNEEMAKQYLLNAQQWLTEYSHNLKDEESLQAASVCCTSLANLHKNDGNLNEARKCFEQALDFVKQTGGDVGLIMYDIVCVLRDSFAFSEAIDMMVACVEWQEEHKSEEDSLIIKSNLELADLFITVGRYNEAIQLMLNLFEVIEQSSTEYCDLLVGMSTCLRVLGDLKGAIVFAERAAFAYRDLCGPYHVGSMMALLTLGDIQREKGLKKQSSIIFNQILQDSVQMDEIEDRSSVEGKAHAYLSEFAENNSNWEKAIFHAEQAVTISGSDEHNLRLAKIRLKSGLAEMARISLEELSETCVDPIIASKIIITLGDCHKEMANNAKSLSCYSRGLASLTRIFGADHLEIAIVSALIGDLYLEMNQSQMAAKHWRHCQSIRRKCLGDSHPLAVLTTYKLGLCEFKIGGVHIGQALQLFKEVNDHLTRGGKIEGNIKKNQVHSMIAQCYRQKAASWKNATSGH